MVSCVVHDCGNYYKKKSARSEERREKRTRIKLFRFPLDEVRREAWVERVEKREKKEEDGTRVHKNSRICSDHFTDEMFLLSNLGHISLTKFAVPTLFGRRKKCPGVFMIPPRPPPSRLIAGRTKIIKLRILKERQQQDNNSNPEVVMADHCYTSAKESGGGDISNSEQSSSKKNSSSNPSSSSKPNSSSSSKIKSSNPSSSKSSSSSSKGSSSSSGFRVEFVRSSIFRTCEGKRAFFADPKVQPGPTVEVSSCPLSCWEERIENRALRKEVSDLKAELSSLKSQLVTEKRKNAPKKKNKKTKEFLTKDQLLFVDKGSMSGHKWSDETIKKALQLKYSCGKHGYEVLLKHNYPLPSLRLLSARKDLLASMTSEVESRNVRTSVEEGREALPVVMASESAKETGRSEG